MGATTMSAVAPFHFGCAIGSSIHHDPERNVDFRGRLLEIAVIPRPHDGWRSIEWIKILSLPRRVAQTSASATSSTSNVISLQRKRTAQFAPQRWPRGAPWSQRPDDSGDPARARGRTS